MVILANSRVSLRTAHVVALGTVSVGGVQALLVM